MLPEDKLVMAGWFTQVGENAGTASPACSAERQRLRRTIAIRRPAILCERNRRCGHDHRGANTLHNGLATGELHAQEGKGTGFNDGPATREKILVPQTGTLVFTNGQTSAEFPVPILDDTLGELAENVGLNLTIPAVAPFWDSPALPC